MEFFSDVCIFFGLEGKGYQGINQILYLFYEGGMPKQHS